MPDSARAQDSTGDVGDRRSDAADAPRDERDFESAVPSTPSSLPLESESTAERYVIRESVPLRESTASLAEDDAYVFETESVVEEDAPTVIRTDRVEGEANSPDDEDTDRAGPGIPAPAEPRHSPFAVQYLAGETLGHFRLDEFVGGGGMGCVFRATDLTLGRTVAVKVLSARGRDADLLARFRNEAQNAARLDHENIARVYYVGADKGWNFIVFEFIEGTNLREVVEREGPLPLERAIDYILQICDALEHAAGRDVVHRDIKPSNVLITPSGRAKLVDMGLARLRQIETPAGDLTASGVTLGTFDYISPEQARDPRFADVRSDIYSLGCTLFFLLTGEPPFAEGSGLQKLLRHTSDHPPDPRDVRADLPERLTRILWKSLAKSPQDRYQSPSEFAGDLALLAEEQGYADALHGRTLVVAAPAEPSPLARVAVWGAALAILLLSALVADEYILPRSGPELPALRPILAKGPALEPSPFQPGESPTGPDSASPNSASAASPAGVDATGSEPREGTLPAPTTSNSGTTPVAATPSGASGAGSASVPSTVLTSPSAAASVRSTEPSPRLFGWPVDADDGSSSISFRPQESLRVDVRASSASRGPEAELELTLGSSQRASASATAPSVAPTANAATFEAGDAVRLIVGDVSEFVQPGDVLAPDLETAIRSMERSPNVRTLELRFHGWKLCPPIRLANRRVTVTAGTGYRPGLLLAPPDVSDAGPAIELVNADIALENVELRWELPLDAADGLALIEARGATSLRVSRSCMTISNLSDLGAPAHADVAFVRVASDAPSFLPDDTAGALSPRFEFSDSVFRGEASLFHAAQGASFGCRWTNGLLVSSERFLVAGARMRRPAWDDLIEISLERVTAIVPEGFARFEATADAAPYFPLAEFSVRDSIVKTRSSAPLIEHRGATDEVEATSSIVDYVGRGDFYPETEIVWQIVPQIGPAMSFDLEAMQTVRWFRVLAPRRQVYWHRRPQTPVSQQTPDDYRLLEDLSNPAYSGSEENGPVGAERSLLPEPLPPPERDAMPLPDPTLPRP